ncbi:hypothetical protein KIW84_033651 [Lathyrus oleraceus]|uniref:Polygalacturonase n=1 Tax=Pisum sativum TaxID=3888 RepID=A0A9D5B3D6_PEA|nr:hypothetical protein KIW84_033651 [Pisum sativum]
MKNSGISIIVSFLFLVDFCAAQPGVLQISNFGGTPNSDITQAFINSWTLACASPTPTKIVIPAGTYMLTGIDVKGPCKTPIEIQVDGTIQEPSDINLVQKGSDQWVRFQYINSLTLSGLGVFDGQGAAVWKQGGVAWEKAMSPNTDGIHIGKSTDVKILNSNIGTGDDCVSLGDGSRKAIVQNINCGPGHCISVGSLRKYTMEYHVAGLLVKNCTLKETDNGLRIKTWPSAPGTITITDMNFEYITMIDVLNYKTLILTLRSLMAPCYCTSALPQGS